MNANQEKSIVGNIFTLTKKTVNVDSLTEDLAQNGVFTPEEQERILCYEDEESRCNLLYETILRKPANCFTILTTSLKRTGNSYLADILDKSLTHDLARPRRHSQLTKRVSCSEFYVGVLDNKMISGKEMGIAEILEENQMLNQNWPLLIKILELDTGPTVYAPFSDFVVKATLILRDWTNAWKKQATLGKLVEQINAARHFASAARIKKMFERADIFEEKWEVDDDEKNPVSIVGKEKIILSILDHNPSFCLHKERLFLMLNLPMEFFKLCTASPGFIKNGMAMLKLWSDIEGGRGASVQKLTALLIQNGHPFTAGGLHSFCHKRKIGETEEAVVNRV